MSGIAGPLPSAGRHVRPPPASVLNQKFLSTLGVDRDRAVTKPFDGGQDVVGGFGPAKGLGVGIAGVDVGRDGGLQRGGRAVGAALDCWSVSNAKKRSTWLIHDADVGVKCICQRSRLANQSRISLVLWLDALSMTM